MVTKVCWTCISTFVIILEFCGERITCEGKAMPPTLDFINGSIRNCYPSRRHNCCIWEYSSPAEIFFLRCDYWAKNVPIRFLEKVNEIQMFSRLYSKLMIMAIQLTAFSYIPENICQANLELLLRELKYLHAFDELALKRLSSYSSWTQRRYF